MSDNKPAASHQNRLTRYDPFERLFHDSLLPNFFDWDGRWGASAFRVDVKDQKDRYLIEAELPGTPREQIEVTAQNGVLTISANMNMQKQDEQEDYLYSERRMGRFQRSFSLEGVREDDVRASYDNGVLKVTLPKQEQRSREISRRIPIE